MYLDKGIWYWLDEGLQNENAESNSSYYSIQFIIVILKIWFFCIDNISKKMNVFVIHHLMSYF